MKRFLISLACWPSSPPGRGTSSISFTFLQDAIKMSRKDFELIASTIWHLELDLETKAKVAKAFANELRNTNANFKRDRFLERCGVT